MKKEIDNRGRPKLNNNDNSDKIEKYENCKILVNRRLKRDLERKAENRGLKTAQLVRIVVNYYNNQSTIKANYVCNREKQNFEKNNDFFYFRLDHDSKIKIIQKAKTRNLYFSELIRIILEEANKQILEFPEKKD